MWQGDIFTALNALQKGQGIVNVIGIVTQANAPKRTTTNGWLVSFFLQATITDKRNRMVMLVRYCRSFYLFQSRLVGCWYWSDLLPQKICGVASASGQG